MLRVFFHRVICQKKHSGTAAFLAVFAFLALFLACLSTDNLLSAILFELACGNVVQAFALRDYWIPVDTSNAFLPASCALKFVTFQVHEFFESFISCRHFSYRTFAANRPAAIELFFLVD